MVVLATADKQLQLERHSSQGHACGPLRATDVKVFGYDDEGRLDFGPVLAQLIVDSGWSSVDIGEHLDDVGWKCLV